MWGFLKSRWLERFQMLNCLQNKTFIDKLGIDKYYFKSMCEIMTTSLQKGLSGSCDCSITRQPRVSAAGLEAIWGR